MFYFRTLKSHKDFEIKSLTVYISDCNGLFGVDDNDETFPFGNLEDNALYKTYKSNTFEK